MIEITSLHNNTYYINPFFIERVCKPAAIGETCIYLYNCDDPYVVAESVEEVIRRIEDDRWEVQISR